jgi:hypothetical protein
MTTAVGNTDLRMIDIDKDLSTTPVELAFVFWGVYFEVRINISSYIISFPAKSLKRVHSTQVV